MHIYRVTPKKNSQRAPSDPSLDKPLPLPGARGSSRTAIVLRAQLARLIVEAGATKVERTYLGLLSRSVTLSMAVLASLPT